MTVLRIAISTAGAGLLLAAGLATAQAPPAAAVPVSQYFDTSSTITLTGTVKAVKLPNAPKTYVLLDVDDGARAGGMWGIEGSAVPALLKLGWSFKVPRTLNIGDKISVTAYRAKAGAPVAETVPPVEGQVVDLAKAGRLVHGTVVTLPNGKKLAFGES